MPKNITAITVENAKKAAPGKRRELFDTQAPGLAIRVTDRGHKSFIWRGRIAGQANPIRVLIGDARVVKIGNARDLAREYSRQALVGHDPRRALKDEKEKQAVAVAAKFELVADRYMKEEVAKMASPRGVEALIRRNLVSAWEGRPIASIRDEDVADVIHAIKERGKLHTAILVLAYAKAIFKWASSLDQRKRTGLRTNPAEAITAQTFKLSVEARQVSLSDDQLRIVWTAAGTMPAPWGAFTRFLILSGQRKSEVSNMTWREIDFKEKLWLIPAERMKGKAGKRREHLVPLTPGMLEILEDLKASQPDDAEFVFSSRNGRKAISSFSDAKLALDAKITAMAKEEGQPFPAWRFHDLRRTVRTGFAKMEQDVPASVAERVIAHAQSGISKVYNVYDYAGEKRKALSLWGSRVKSIIEPGDPDNLLIFKKGA